MSESVITVEGLSKRYVIGSQRERGEGMRHAIERAMRSPLGWMRASMKQSTALEEFWALRDLNLEVRRGEVVGIIGRNGAGKSTLLKILSRITDPTEGRIRIRGRVASLLEVGTGFHPELTGRENVFLNGAILGMSRAEIKQKFDEIAAFAEVERFLDTPVKRYSSGMQVRLAFAVAAHLEPEILIVDEVLAVGDIAFQKKCLGRMRDVASHGGSNGAVRQPQHRCVVQPVQPRRGPGRGRRPGRYGHPFCLVALPEKLLDQERDFARQLERAENRERHHRRGGASEGDLRPEDFV